MGHDWNAWARRVEQALDVAKRSDTDFQSLFAPDAEYVDPTQTASTSELPEVSRRTRESFPDWRTEVTSVRGAEDWAVLEWIGRGTYTSNDGAGISAKIEMPGVTIVDVDTQGRVTRWRDYFDMKSVEEQIRGAAQ